MRSLVVAALVGALFVGAAPVSAARSFSFTACWDGDSVVGTITWSGFRVDEYAFGQGQLDGSGFAFFVPIDTATSGSYSNDYGVNLDDTVDLIGGSVYYRTTRHAIKSDQILRPSGGWATLDPC